MSFNVLVIPEDQTLNGYILKPLAEAIVTDAGKPQANITVLPKPRLNGYSAAHDAILRGELDDRYRHFDLWLFMPDADLATDGAMNNLEGALAKRGIRLLCCPAQPEVEIYACLAYRDEFEWVQARASTSMKEDFFKGLLQRHGDPRRPGGGRDLMIQKSLENLQTLYTFCPELARLRDRIITKETP